MAKPHLFANCPICGKTAKFEIKNSNGCSYHNYYDSIEEFLETCSPDEMCRRYELFAMCGVCHFGSIFVVSEPFNDATSEVRTRPLPMDIKGSLNGMFDIEGIVRICDNVAVPSPKFITRDIGKAFREGTDCLSIRCWNAACAMFRACLDLATKDMLPEDNVEGLTAEHRGKLAPRIKWLHAAGVLPDDLKDLAECIKDDGNEGVHEVILTKEDAMEVFNFTVMLLEYVYTAPAMRKDAKKKRDVRKAKHAESRKQV